MNNVKTCTMEKFEIANPYMKAFLKVLDSPERLQKFNLRTGVYDKDGNLTPEYRIHDKCAS